MFNLDREKASLGEASRQLLVLDDGECGRSATMTLLDRIRPSRLPNRSSEYPRLLGQGNNIGGTRSWSGTRFLGRRTHTLRLIFSAIACISLFYTFATGPHTYPRSAISTLEASTEPRFAIDSIAIDNGLVKQSVIGNGAIEEDTNDRVVVDQSINDGKDTNEKKGGYRWQQFRSLKSYFNGVRTLTPALLHKPENRYDQGDPPEALTPEEIADLSKQPTLHPLRFDPYPNYMSHEYLADHHPVEQCYLDPEEKNIPVPHVHAFYGLPLNAADPFYGSYSELDIRGDVCWDRYGRLASYGYGYNASAESAGPGTNSEMMGSWEVFKMIGEVDYSNMNWGVAQKRCSEVNSARFNRQQLPDKKRVPKQAFVLRTWTGYPYGPAQILSLRAMVSELSLKSGGEYDVHFLVHVKDDSLPIWDDADLYRRTLEENVPREFWGISTLWSEDQMRKHYPSPPGDNFANMVESDLHSAYRSPHFALQWFSQEHPEYDFIWNWEMDVRYSGHYYDLASKVGIWAEKQPRKGLWERNKRFWIPKYHGDYSNFTKFVEREIEEVDVLVNNRRLNGPLPVWGPVRDFNDETMLPALPENMPPRTYEEDNYEWGVGEDADLIVFNPIFDPSETNWVFRKDVTGYPLKENLPPRRAAIGTVGRLSRRLLDTMHEETPKFRHTMFSQMWPATVSLHHGYKAVYAPHPVFFDHDWDVEYMAQQLNPPMKDWQMPFGWSENNLLGSTFYYNSDFAATLWRRWLGQVEDGEGGRRYEEDHTGRMCLRPMLHHPVKHENGPEEKPPDPPAEEPEVLHAIEDVAAKAKEEAFVEEVEEAKLKDAALEEERAEQAGIEVAEKASVEGTGLTATAIEASQLKEIFAEEAKLKDAAAEDATLKTTAIDEAKTKEVTQAANDETPPPPSSPDHPPKPDNREQEANTVADANKKPASETPNIGEVSGPATGALPSLMEYQTTRTGSEKGKERPLPPGLMPRKKPKPLNM